MIDSFQGKYRWLSNFWPATVTLDGDIYPTVEHAYQAAKTLDLFMRTEIRCAATPWKAKKIGKFINVRPNLKNLRYGIMLDLVTQKFTNHLELKEKLLATGDKELVEGNNWNDTYWGVCSGVGENNLGKILMHVRSELRK